MPVMQIGPVMQTWQIWPVVRQRCACPAPPCGKAHGPSNGGCHQPRAAGRGIALSVRGAQPLYRKNHAMFPR